ncbi:MAG: serine/threonine-protein kinase [Oscillatoria sp. PMC 1051.18]|nr:serine/threonine-protein kinase [Oscillatoria sp. PMC 1050.18]MEC5029285.1 serine/threonine-protein kinase [Oscillatoria sp. PMC 1051.18]
MTLQLLNNRYHVIRTLGSGGFSETFLAEDTQMPSSRLCVIKQLKPANNNPELYQLVQERFAREAAILEKLGEANSQIPKLYAYLSEGGQFYLVQEWIEGDTLTQLVQKQGKLSESTVKEILISILPVLDYVHGQQIVHRDIKPDNIIIRSSDRVPVLIDFGAVREAMGTTLSSQGNYTSSIVIGTPGFMPSEQAAGRPLYSSDLYSLGLTAIYLLTGKIPQDLTSDPQTGEVIWQQYAPQISDSFTAVLNKAVMSHPKERYYTADEMLAALQGSPRSSQKTISYQQQQQKFSPSPSPSPSPQKSNKGLISSLIIGGFVGVVVVVAFALFSDELFPPNVPDSPDNPTPSQPQNPSPVPKPSSQTALINYYEAINNQQYQAAWNLRTPSSQNDETQHPEGYKSFTDWWTQVRRVDILDLDVVGESGDFATVDSELRYFLNSGKTIDQSLRFNFIWDNQREEWLLDDVERL